MVAVCVGVPDTEAVCVGEPVRTAVPVTEGVVVVVGGGVATCDAVCEGVV